MQSSFFHSLLLGAGCLGFAALLPNLSQGQTLEADYQLQDTYASSVGKIGPLAVVGSSNGVTFTTADVDGTTQDVLNIAAGGVGTSGTSGVQTQTAGFGISATNYSVALTADFNLTATGVLATKILDFDNLSSDAGLYVTAATGTLEFINGAGVLQGAGGAAIGSGNYLQLALTRDGRTGLTSVYENGALAFSFTDSSDLAVLGDSTSSGNAYLTLFKDDGMGLGGAVINESSQGDLARLQIYDGVLSAAQVAALDVPEPSSWALLGLGGILLFLGARSIRRRAN